jgi:hypothetical protein
MMCIPHHEQKPDRVQYHFMDHTEFMVRALEGSVRNLMG